MDLKATIDHAFGWSNNEHQEQPGMAFLGIKGSPDVIPALKDIIKARNLRGDDLLVFHWWMGVKLDIIPSQIK